jgi:hypothetical protein
MHLFNAACKGACDLIFYVTSSSHKEHVKIIVAIVYDNFKYVSCY